MPQQNTTNRSPIEDWQVENLRLTAFPISLEQDIDSWWFDVVGELPESSTSQPRRRTEQKKGSIDDIGLTLTVQPNRIDWLLSLAEDQGIVPESFPLIGAFPDLRNWFVTLMQHWFELETCPSLHRLAFGAVLLQPTGSKVEGYRQLNNYLHDVTLDPENTSDFNYQINRPRPTRSRIDGLSVNRLSRWNVATLRGFTVAVPSSFGLLPDLELYACRLELDINTSQFFQGEIAREQLPEVFLELVELGVEIIREGDIP